MTSVVLRAVTSVAAVRLPDMTVIELSVVVARLRDGALRPDRVARVIADWFVRPVHVPDLAPSLARKAAEGWVSGGTGGDLSPTHAAEQPTLLLCAGLIRMIGSVEGGEGVEARLRRRDLEEGEEP